ncbi:PREDICTED: uncharacterized protein LOC104813948 [Tarenaya hassleriana]|uniref:uncharacterized protein LOC104813948 n=1 Tax=Tarenaya hassleriana TaxID=28532 RepID=UPI00053C0D97|nr:PREDICTED: uncharacterized protein LOC104813948 [Tarenaya hassleriana]
MTTTSVKNNGLPAGLVSNLQEVLSKRRGGNEEGGEAADGSGPEPPSTSDAAETAPSPAEEEIGDSNPIVLVTNADGIDSPGLVSLVEALVREGLYNVHVCAPQTDRSSSGHSMTPGETIAVSSADMEGATAFEVSGTPVDCISLALSGALFSWSKPILVISGINRGSSCGHNMYYSGVVAGAREALISGVPSLSISLNWKKDGSQENDFKDAVGVCLPLINATIRDLGEGVFPKDCSLNIEIPTSPSTNKGFKVTRQSMWRHSPSWQAVSVNRHPGAGNFMSNQQSLGLQLAQLSRDASAAGAARRLATQRKSIVEIESVGIAGKADNRVKKYFRLEFLDKGQEDMEDDLDWKAVEDGFVSVTPLSLLPKTESEIQAATSEWISDRIRR